MNTGLPASGEDPAEEEGEEVSGFLRTGEWDSLTWRDSSPPMRVVRKFSVVRERSSRSLEMAGRFRVEGEMVVIYLDGIGSFQVGRVQVISVVLRTGEEGIPGPGWRVSRDDEPVREWKGSEEKNSGAIVRDSGIEV